MNIKLQKIIYDLCKFKKVIWQFYILSIIIMNNWINYITESNKIKKRKRIFFNLRNVYYPILYFKWIKVIRKQRKSELDKNMNISLLNIKYMNYILAMKKLDSQNNRDFNILSCNNDKYLDLIEENNRLTKNLNTNLIQDIQIKSVYENISEEYSKDIYLRKMGNKLMVPHYFFTPAFIEKSKPSQIRHWTSSIYNFLKSSKVNKHYLDYYTEKLINSFFNINVIKIKNIWDEKFLFNGYKILPNYNIIQDMNSLIKYTSTRTSKSLRNVINYPKVILNNAWVKEKIKFSIYLKELIKDRKTLKLGGFFAKKRIELDYNSKALLSKPLFKHTSYNLIIDLFLFNNKKYLFNKFDHIIWRRIMYKYMYSMYVDFSSKIYDTINRPRFFYINILEPRIYNYYKKITKEYKSILILKSKMYFVYLCLSLLNIKYLINNEIFFFNKRKENNNKYIMFNKIKVKNRDEKVSFLDKKREKVNRLIELNNDTKVTNEWLTRFVTKYYLLNMEKRKNIFEDKLIKDFLNEFKKSLINYDVELNNNFNKLKKNGLKNKKDCKREIIRETKCFNKLKENDIYIDNFNYLNSCDNSKVVWDNLDYSLISILNTLLKIKKDKWVLSELTINLLTKIINNVTINSNIFVFFFKLALIEKEFYLVNKDIIKINGLNEINIWDNKMVNKYYNFRNNIKDKIYLKGNKKNKTINLHLWRSYFDKKNAIKPIYIYNDKLFKPYYRYTIPIFILQSYKLLLSNIGFKNINTLFNKYFIKFNQLKWFRINNNNLFNYIIVKILLDLFRYNYRSLIKIKPKYYYINKLRFYESKIRRLKFNTWLSAIKYLKRLRKTPRNFWKRYHKLAAFYFGRVIQNAELDTQRKVFIPFLIYFEDILYTIYNKPVIIRLWPLKKYFLSSVILVKRIMATILMRQHKVSLGGYRKVIRKLMSTFRGLEIKKAYDYYIYNNSQWPTNLINALNIDKAKYNMKYENLEYYSKKKDRYHYLNTYFIKHLDLSNYIQNINNNYTQAFKNNILKLKLGIKRQVMKSFKRSHISKLNYTYYWVRPLKNYIMQMRRNLDISGIKFRLGGRSGIRRTNMRKFKKIKYFGNLMGPVHSSMKVKKNISLYNPQILGHIRSNIDYSCAWGITRNGCLSLKIWISSLFSVDLRELLLHLIKIKHLYYQLINRYYVIETKLVNINNNYYLKSINNKIHEFNNKKNIFNKEKVFKD